MKEFKIDKEYKLVWNPKTEVWDIYRFDMVFPKSTEKLIKFYALNLNSIDALYRNYFYLSNPGNFNDPFDCNLNLIDDIGSLDELETVCKNSYTNVGICAFSETIDNHLMWAHYTNNYNGFALEFKGDSIDAKLRRDEISRHTLTRVIYPEKPVKIFKDYPFAQHYVLTTKFKHWEYEKEWRIISELKGDNREMEYYPESVKGIYIGHGIPDNSKNLYRLILDLQEFRFPKIPVYVVYPHPTDLKLRFEKVWN